MNFPSVTPEKIKQNGRRTQQKILSTATKTRNLGEIIGVSPTKTATVSLEVGDTYTFAMTTSPKYPLALETQWDVSMFEGSIVEELQIPTGSSVSPANYQIIGPWRDQDEGDGVNIVNKISLKNVSTLGVSNVTIFSGVVIQFPLYTHQRTTATTSDNRIIWVYQDVASYPNASLEFVVSNNNGLTWSSPVVINPSIDITNTGSQYSIWKDSSNNIYVVYAYGASGTSGALKFVKLTYAFGEWTVGNIYTIQAFDATNNLSQASIVITSAGRIFVVYSHSDNSSTSTLRSRYSDDDGATWSAASDVLTATTSPHLVLRNDVPFVVWYQAVGILRKIRYSVWGGSSWGAADAFTISGNTNTRYGVVEDSSHNIHVVSLNPNSVFEYSFYNGSAWSMVETLTPTNVYIGDSLSLSLDSNGTDLQLFYMNSTGLTTGPIVKRVRSSGAWGSQTTVYNTNNSNHVETPEQFASSATYAIIGYGNGGIGDSNSNIIVNTDIFSFTKTIIFKGQTRYLSPIASVQTT